MKNADARVPAKLDGAAREQRIIEFLLEHPGGASLTETFDHCSDAHGDTVSRTAYSKVMERMVAEGRLDVRAEPDGKRIFSAPETISAYTPITLDKLRELLSAVEATDLLAQAVDAQRYYDDHRTDVLRTAANALMREDPRDLVFRFFKSLAELFNRQLDVVFDSQIVDEHERNRLDNLRDEIVALAYRNLSLPTDEVLIPSPLLLRQSAEKARITYDPARVRELLEERVFGPAFIYEIDASDAEGLFDDEVSIVSGSDGSSHVSSLQMRTGGRFVEEVTDAVTFNTAVSFAKTPPQQRGPHQAGGMFHSMPLTREAMERSKDDGLVLSPILYPDLSEAEYEHMSKSATDVVQMKVDYETFDGEGRDVRTNRVIPKPQVHIRDGTVVPQERELNHYNRDDAYGMSVRRGMHYQRRILQRVMAARPAPVFAGAVKATQRRVFGAIVNWYISTGSKNRGGVEQPAIDPNWDMSRARYISDNGAMTALLAAISDRARLKKKKYFVTCSLRRRFHSTTDMWSVKLNGMSWLGFFRKRARRDSDEHRDHGAIETWHAKTDLTDDDFVWLCEHADYVAFYIGHTAGEPAPMIPRYEFITSLVNVAEPAEIVRVAVKRVVVALERSGITQDRDHNFLTGKTLTKILPFVIQQAHEVCKSIGATFEREVASTIIAKIGQLSRRRLNGATLVPIATRGFVERWARAREAQPSNAPEE